MFVVAVVLGALTACEKVNLDEIINQGGSDDVQTEQSEYVKRFTFTVKGDFTNPEFAGGEDEGSAPANGPKRANSYMTADGSEMTDLWVIDYKDGEIKQQLHQSASDEDWGKPQMSLTLGEHHVLFLASRGTEPQYQNGVVSWTKPLDTFYTDYEVTVVKTSNGNRAVTLDRVATKVMLVVEDMIPQGTTAMVMNPSLWFTGYDMLNGQPVATTEYELSLTLPSTWQGTSGKSFTAWSLSSKEEWTTTLHYTSMAGSTKNGEITIPNAPFKANRTTTYRGKFYSDITESSVTLNSEWEPEYEGVY